MSSSAFFKNLARVAKNFSLDVGPLHARGAPAVLVAVSGLVTAIGLAKAISANAERLPETLREARALEQTLRNDAPQLNR